MIESIATSDRVPAVPSPLTPELICAQHGARVGRFALMVTRNVTDAEDLAQSSLLKAITRLHQYDPARGSVEAWLWRIVVNSHRDRNRLAARARRLLWLLGPLAPAGGDAAETALSSLRDDEIRAAVSRLGARDRRLIALRFTVGLDTASVAEVVGMKPEATARAIRRALERLRRALPNQ